MCHFLLLCLTMDVFITSYQATLISILVHFNYCFLSWLCFTTINLPPKKGCRKPYHSRKRLHKTTKVERKIRIWWELREAKQRKIHCRPIRLHTSSFGLTNIWFDIPDLIRTTNHKVIQFDIVHCSALIASTTVIFLVNEFDWIPNQRHFMLSS